MNVTYDLHIHSALSPCGDNDMTPNNIVNMAIIKKLDVISITDHNSMRNLIPTFEIAKEKGILVIPGIEVTTKEEVHVLCYFPTIEEGMSFQNIIYESLPNIQNSEEIFGEQLIFDKEDNIKGKLSKMLLNSSKYSLEEINKLVLDFNGVLIPAHVDRDSFSILSNLGFIPNTLSVNCIEVSDLNKISDIKKVLAIERVKVLKNSDAHFLGDINEALNYLKIDELTIEAVINYLKLRSDEN